MNIEKFQIDGFGEINIDKVLFEGYCPILFTCKNKDNDLFLVVHCTSNNEMQKWLITKTDSKNIIDLLQDKKTIREAFLCDEENRFSYIIQNDEEKVLNGKETDDWSVNSNYLPTVGEFMNVEEDEFLEEIEYFERLITPQYKNGW